jgi:alpha-L-arabinofuranosidase
VRLGGAVLALACGCGRLGFGSRDDVPAADGPPVDVGDVLATALAHWPFDEGSGTLAADATGHNHSLALMNNVVWRDGMFGKAIETDGVGAYLVSPMFDFTQTTGVTVSFWMVHDYGGGAAFDVALELGDDINTNKGGFGIFPDDTNDCNGQMALSLQGDVGYSASCFPQPSSFLYHHFVAVFDKAAPGTTETRLYVDGVEEAPTPVFTMDNTNTFGALQLFLFARGGASSFSAGVMDELILFDRALTPAEIAAL